MLDCLTEKGQKFIQCENWTADFLEEKYLQPKNQRFQKFKYLWSSADRFLISNRTKKKLALIEIKCRQTTKDSYEKYFDNKYLISTHKVDANLKDSKKYGIPFFLFVNLMKDDYLIRIQISDNQGNLIAPHDLDTRQTQATCNGNTKTDMVYLFHLEKPYAYFISKS